MRMILCFAGLAVVAASASAAVEPSWRVGATNGRCMLLHERSEGQPGIAIQPVPGSNLYEVTLLLPRQGTVPFGKPGRFVTGGLEAFDGERGILSEERPNSPDRFLQTKIDSDELALVRRSEMVGMTVSNHVSVVERMPGLGQAIRDLAVCERRVAGNS